MKYIAIVDDELLANFRVDIKSNGQSCSDMVLVVTDKAGITRGIGLKPLPKGYGRLIDADVLRDEVGSWGMNDYKPSDFIDEIDRADTIIKADKEQEDGNDN